MCWGSFALFMFHKKHSKYFGVGKPNNKTHCASNRFHPGKTELGNS